MTSHTAHELLQDHPIVGKLRWVRLPEGRRKDIVEALCRGGPDADRLPTDQEIAAELGMAPGTVAQQLDRLADLIDGATALDRRARIVLCQWDYEWRLSHGASSG